MLYWNVWYISHVLDLENVYVNTFSGTQGKCAVNVMCSWSCEISGTQRKWAVNIICLSSWKCKRYIKFLVLQGNVLCILFWKCTWNGKFPLIQGNVPGRWHFLSTKLQKFLSSKFHSKISFTFPAVF